MGKGSYAASKLSVSQYLFSYAEARMLTFQKLLLTGTRWWSATWIRST